MGRAKETAIRLYRTGVAMLSGVLNSETAIRVHVQIIRVFAKMKEMIMMNKDILIQLEKIESKLVRHDKDIIRIFKYLKKLLTPDLPPRPRVGFRRKDET